LEAQNRPVVSLLFKLLGRLSKIRIYDMAGSRIFIRGKMDLSRTRALIGAENMDRLAKSKIAVAGLGGVGGYAAEALLRSGVGTLILADGDTVDPSNLNRQIFAVEQTVGLSKTEAAKQRLLAIDPGANLILIQEFLTPENLGLLFDEGPDFVIDAVDTVTTKLALAKETAERSVGFISSMGAGNRLDPTAFRIGGIADTAGCGDGLSRVMRREAKKRGLDFKVVYSLETPQEITLSGENGKHPPASAGWVVGAAGLALASEAIRYICVGNGLDHSGG